MPIRPVRLFLALTPSAGAGIAIAIMLLASLRREIGFFVFFFALGALIWLIAQLFTLTFSKARIVHIASDSAWWGLAFLIVALTHRYYANAIQAEANHVGTSIDHYHADHGTYPPMLAAIGIHSQYMKGTGKFIYVVDRGAPYLAYRSTFDGFDTYYYDFEKHQWEFHPD